MEQKVAPRAENFLAVRTRVCDAELDGQPVVRVAKGAGLVTPDINTYARAKDLTFHNGIITIRMLSRLLPDAPAHARGFVGIVFRASENDAEFESFYVRPTNGRACTDPVRRAHGCQYFSYPGYTFDYFREHGIAGYEAPADIDLNEWITLRAVIEDRRAAFYLNGAQEPVLVVDDLKHGAGSRGGVGIYVDIGTDAYVSDFRVICTD